MSRYQLPARGAIAAEKRKQVAWAGTPPAHHANASRTRFQNPWPSFRFPRTLQQLKFAAAFPFIRPEVPVDLGERIPSRVPDWGAGKHPNDVKATWLGHACFLVELPTPEGATRGPRIIFDPVMSHRCSPSQWIGPQRLLPPPVAAEDIPEVDAVVISHNHYDHMDFPTLNALRELHNPHFFAPLGNEPHLAAVGIPESHIHTLDWWEESAVAVDLSPFSRPIASEHHEVKDSNVNASFILTCTPAQHLSNRGLFDRWHTLWSSWAVTEDVPTPAPGSPTRQPRKVFFGGDTGYKTIWPGEEDREDILPHCPAFAEIGERFGAFDLALLPIGAYGPRTMFSSMHASPRDAVAIFKDIRAKRALGMHWGTWTMTAEPTMEPPALLCEECANAGVPEGAFGVCELGETVVV